MIPTLADLRFTIEGVAMNPEHPRTPQPYVWPAVSVKPLGGRKRDVGEARPGQAVRAKARSKRRRR